MPELMMLVGLPGVGKTTFIDQKWGKQSENSVYASTDAYIDTIAMMDGKSYNEVFNKENMKKAEKLMLDSVRNAIQFDLDVIWDQTNLSVKSRANKLAMFPDHYTKIAVVLICDPEEHQKRIDSRPGKKIPPFVIDSMRKRYEEPTRDEGFSAVVFYNVVNGEWSEITIGNL